jgi:hypothetical protein
MTDRAKPAPSLLRATGADFLSEDDVVRAVMAHLESGGWTIQSFALSHQHGDDIVAALGAEKFIIEAKGQGSARVGSRRYGLAFTRNQVGTHVAVAVVRAMRTVSEGDALAGIALPSDELHRAEVKRIAPALSLLGVEIFWVAADGSVEPGP